MSDPRPTVTFSCPRCGGEHTAKRVTLGLCVWGGANCGDASVSVKVRAIDDAIDDTSVHFTRFVDDCTAAESWRYVDGVRVDN